MIKTQAIGLASAFAVTILGTLLAGCASTPTAGLVRITHNPNDIQSCKNLGEVDGSSFNPMTLANQRTEVAARGGDTLYTPPDVRIAVMRNVAYRCGS
jgi:hypothetical protein